MEEYTVGLHLRATFGSDRGWGGFRSPSVEDLALIAVWQFSGASVLFPSFFVSSPSRLPIPSLFFSCLSFSDLPHPPVPFAASLPFSLPYHLSYLLFSVLSHPFFFFPFPLFTRALEAGKCMLPILRGSAMLSFLVYDKCYMHVCVAWCQSDLDETRQIRCARLSNR